MAKDFLTMTTRSNRQEIEAIADSVLGKHRAFIEPQLAEMLTQIQQVGRDTDVKLTAIQTELATLSATLSTTRSEVKALETAVEANCDTLKDHSHTLRAMEAKLADLEDRNRRCNIRVIGLPERAEGSNATQFLSRSLPEWFPTLRGLQIEIMRAHRIYSDNASNRGANRTLIFNTLRYPTRQAILAASRKNPLSIDGRRIRFSPDYSNHTVKRRQAMHQAMNAARAKGLDFFLIYPATLKIKDGDQYEAFTSPIEAENFVKAAPDPRQGSVAGVDGAPPRPT